jgi:hypothetical protein
VKRRCTPDASWPRSKVLCYVWARRTTHQSMHPHAHMHCNCVTLPRPRMRTTLHGTHVPAHARLPYYIAMQKGRL